MCISLQLKFWLSIELFIYQFIKVYFVTKKSGFKQKFYIFVFCSKTKSQKPYRVNGSWWADQKTRNELGSSRAVNLCLACAKTDFSGLPKITELPPLAVRRSRGPSTDCVEFYAAISIFPSICEVLLFYIVICIVTSVSKISGQAIVLYHYCGLSRFF